MKKVKTVAFNMLNPIDRRLYNHMKRQGYFSTHIKRLIQRDLEQGKNVSSEGSSTKLKTE
ncbi:hypothetical protein BACCIP111899_04145 [Bacillus rhizoplanae]|uniref:Fur-regulated basic protein FbpA n=1 Tax=Bacillus rhizoplanae TaxID=2880966 RepID=A0ABM8YGF8_9BACI|nr:hypothetical protein [Bacillus rhizoplanae]CAG9614912.1 hypothetical protein BACCIP111899_04145 [Bacillus rhizoplanae]